MKDSEEKTNEPILLCPNPVDINQEELSELVEELCSVGLEARPAYLESEGFGIDVWWEVIAIWVGAEASRAIVNQTVGLVVEWAKHRFQKSVEEDYHLRSLPARSRRQKGLKLEVVRYESNEGHIVEIVELEADDDSPFRRLPEGFEKNAVFKPREITISVPEEPGEDIEQELPRLKLPAITGNEEDLLRENRGNLYEKARVYPQEAVTGAWLLIETAVHLAAIRNSVDLSADVADLLSELAEKELVPDFIADTIQTLRNIRSRIDPRPMPGLPTSDAIAYVDTAVRAAVYLARA